MPTKQEIKHYTAHMKMYASMLHDLADSESYVIWLIENDGLDKFEESLRRLICKHNFEKAEHYKNAAS